MRTWFVFPEVARGYLFTLLAASSAVSMGYLLPWYCLLKGHYAAERSGSAVDLWARLEPIRARIRSMTGLYRGADAFNTEVEYAVYANELAAAAESGHPQARGRVFPVVVADLSPWLEGFSDATQRKALRASLDICESEIRGSTRDRRS